MSVIGYETIIFQVDTVTRPWAKLFNYINIRDFSYPKKGQHSPTAAVWLFLLSKLYERTVPVSFSALEMSFLGTDQEELAIIPFFYRPCNAQSSVQGMRSMFIMYTFCDLHTHSMLLFQEALGKGFIHHAVGRHCHIFSLEAVFWDVTDRFRQRSFKGSVNIARHPQKRLRGRLVFSGLEMKSPMRLTRMSSFSCFLSLFVSKTLHTLYFLSVQNFFGWNAAVLKINMMIGWMIVRWLSDWTPPATQAVGQH